MENFLEIIANNDIDDSSTGLESDVFNLDMNELEASVIGLPRQFKPIRLAEDTVIIASKKAAQNTDIDINGAFDLPELAVPPIPVENEINNDEQQTNDSTSLLTDKASFISKDTIMTHEDTKDADTIDESFIDQQINPIHMEEREARDDHMLGRIVDMLFLPEYYKHSMPSYESRFASKTIKEDIPSRFNRMVNFANKCFEIITSSVCPGPSLDILRKECISNLNKKYTPPVSKAAKRSKKCSIGNVVDDTSTSSPTNYKRKWDRLSDVVCTVAKSQMKGSIERRVARALFYNGCVYTDFNNLLKKHGMKFGQSQPMRQAKLDYKELISGNKLQRETVSFCRVEESTVEAAVEFILSPENIVTRSYGVKDVSLSKSEIIRLPRLQRTKSRQQIIRNYNEYVYQNSSVGSLKKSTLYYMLNLITSSDMKMVCAVDYVTTCLVNDSVELMQDIIEKCVSDSNQNQATSLLTSVSFFLKHEYAKLVSKRDNICFHGLHYALSRCMESRVDNYQCNGSRFPFFFCHQLKKWISENRSEDINRETKEDAKKVIHDISVKFSLYMAHVCRCKCQNLYISGIDDRHQRICKYSKGTNIDGTLILDFKMKFEAMSMRESTIEHFGKRGIGWHGCALVFYQYEDILNNDGSTQLDDNGQPKKGPVRKIVYIDQIIEDNNRQDGLAVLGLLECVVSHINLRFPFIKNLVLQSDNAGTYQNHELLIGIHFINMRLKGKILIKEFIHSETQDGKTILDAHFAVAVITLLEFMKTCRANRITKIQTPSGLAKALSYRGGTPNSIVHLIELDRSRLEQIKNMIKGAIKDGK